MSCLHSRKRDWGAYLRASTRVLQQSRKAVGDELLKAVKGAMLSVQPRNKLARALQSEVEVREHGLQV